MVEVELFVSYGKGPFIYRSSKLIFLLVMVQTSKILEALRTIGEDPQQKVSSEDGIYSISHRVMDTKEHAGALGR